MRPLVSWQAALIAALVAVVPPFVAAHGPSPAVLGVVAGIERPTLLRLSVGLAEWTEDEWQWVCPTIWGGDESPTVVPIEDGVLLLTESGAGTIRVGTPYRAVNDDLLGGDTLRDVSSAGATVHLLLWASDGSRVVEWSSESGPADIMASEERWHSVTVSATGMPTVARVEGGVLVLHNHSGEFPAGEYEVGAAGSTPDLRAAGGSLFAVLVAGDSRLVDLVEPAIPMFASPAVIHGPVAVGEAILAVSDGTLWRLEEEAVPLDDPRRWTCLHEGPNGHAYACTQLAVHRLGAEGLVEEQIFDLRDLRPPDPSRLSADAWELCWGEWADYASHAGIEVGVRDEDPPPAGRPRNSQAGCASAVRIASAGSTVTGAGLACIILMWSRRRRELEASRDEDVSAETPGSAAL